MLQFSKILIEKQQETNLLEELTVLGHRESFQCGGDPAMSRKMFASASWRVDEVKDLDKTLINTYNLGFQGSLIEMN